MKVRLVLFKDGRRLEKLYDDPREAASVAVKLRRKGVKVNLSTCLLVRKRLFPPEDDNLYLREEGMLWCPYCGDWRWFKVPKFRGEAPPRSPDWFLNSFHRQGIKVCAWCQITEGDFWVRKANSTWGDTGRKRRRRKRKVR